MHYCVKSRTRRQVVDELYAHLLGTGDENFFYDENTGNGPSANGSATNGNTAANGPANVHHPPPGKGKASQKPVHLISDPDGVVRLYRHGPLTTTWQITSETPRSFKLYHPSLYRRKEVCHDIERELMSVLGIDNYKTSPFNATVSINYTPKKIRREQIIEILDTAMAHIEVPVKKDKIDLTFPLLPASVPLAAVRAICRAGAHARFRWPCSPTRRFTTFKQDRTKSVSTEKRLGVDVLDSIVVVACLTTGAVFAGSVLCLCLEGRAGSCSRRLRTIRRKLLMSVFGKA